MFCIHTHTVYLDKDCQKYSTSHCILYNISPRKVTFATDPMVHCFLDIIQWFLHTNDTTLLHGCTRSMTVPVSDIPTTNIANYLHTHFSSHSLRTIPKMPTFIIYECTQITILNTFFTSEMRDKTESHTWLAGTILPLDHTILSLAEEYMPCWLCKTTYTFIV